LPWDEFEKQEDKIYKNMTFRKLVLSPSSGVGKIATHRRHSPTESKSRTKAFECANAFHLPLVPASDRFRVPIKI